MSRQIQIRRGTAAEHDNFTGAIGEVTMDTTNKTLRVHDGVTVGGNMLMLASEKVKMDITNCITEIPQNIKLELNSGTLKLKSGSKFYVPNGKSSVSTDTNLQSQRLWNTVFYNGTKFVCIGNTGYTSTSSDGVNWAASAKGSNIGSKSWKSITYDGTEYIAIGNGGWISISSDMTSWTTPSQKIYAYTWVDIVYNGNQILALSNTGYVSTSVNATTWTTPVQNANLGENSWQRLLWDGTKYIALSDTGYISTSTDGTTWTTAVAVANLGTDKHWRGLAYNGSIYVALSKTGYISTSTDGTTWTAATYNSNLGSNEWMTIAYGNGVFAAIGNSAYTAVSLDGVNWGQVFYNEITVENDVTVDAQSTTGQTMVFYNNTTSQARCDISIDYCLSGTTASANSIFYKTDENIIDCYDGSSVAEGSKYSFPLAIVTVSGGTVTSIDKVFNGFGYIGSTVFALPDVKGLIPNGLNIDGSVKSTEFTVYEVLSYNISGTYSDLPVVLSGDAITFNSGFEYNESVNITSDGKMQVGSVNVVSGKITSFNIKSVYNPTDYNDFKSLKNNAITTVSNSKTQSGYYKLSNGLIVQWMQISSAVQDAVYDWPVSFTSATSYIAVPTYNNQVESEVPVQIWEQTATTVSLHRYGGLSGFNIGIIAIGY